MNKGKCFVCIHDSGEVFQFKNYSDAVTFASAKNLDADDFCISRLNYWENLQGYTL